ncbi:MAG TPA: MarR family transcriptional regulator [Ktedonobacteraceae bacterium]|nr:MarR family transcriptional regulator [Ktedonobacteraceae bacterium]
MSNTDWEHTPQPVIEEHESVGSLPSSTGFILNKASQEILRRCEEVLVPLGIRLRHYSILALLGKGRVLSQNEIGKRLGLDRNNVVVLMNYLEQKQLVVRDQDPTDRRVHAIHLTPHGEALLQEASTRLVEAENQVLSRLTHEELQQLNRLLSKLLLDTDSLIQLEDATRG